VSADAAFQPLDLMSFALDLGEETSSMEGKNHTRRRAQSVSPFLWLAAITKWEGIQRFGPWKSRSRTCGSQSLTCRQIWEGFFVADAREIGR
jgi:hypothetical protein